MGTERVSGKFLTLLILGALTTVTPLSVDMYLPAFPRIAEELHTTVSRISLSLSSYFVGLTIGQIICGPLLDRFGRKRPVYFGLALYVLAAIGCLNAHTVTMLVAFRFLQALGACVAQVAATALVRDLFPGAEGARAFSSLMLVLSVSPLLAPTAGGFITDAWGWRWVFLVLILIVCLVLFAVVFFLPSGRAGDRTVVLHPRPIFTAFITILKEPQFYAYVLSGAMAFAGLLVYVASSPVLFLQIFPVGTKTYGAIFAMLSVGFIGGGQLNLFLSRRFTPDAIFRAALTGQVGVGILFLLSAWAGWCGLPLTVVFLGLYLSCLGLIYPNASAIALAPFETNAGQASALLGFLQTGSAALASMVVGLLEPHSLPPIVALLAGSGALGWCIFYLGKKNLGTLRGLGESTQLISVH
jgi:DHA1 family bicyclomycin/chloramphenicol resistance-like MFS transporter